MIPFTPSRSSLPPTVAMQKIDTALLLAGALALTMSLLTGLIWSLWWPASAAFIFGCIYVSMGNGPWSRLYRMLISIAATATVSAAGFLGGCVAAGSLGCLLLLALLLDSPRAEATLEGVA